MSIIITALKDGNASMDDFLTGSSTRGFPWRSVGSLPVTTVDLQSKSNRCTNRQWFSSSDSSKELIYRASWECGETRANSVSWSSRNRATRCLSRAQARVAFGFRGDLCLFYATGYGVSKSQRRGTICVFLLFDRFTSETTMKRWSWFSGNYILRNVFSIDLSQ